MFNTIRDVKSAPDLIYKIFINVIYTFIVSLFILGFFSYHGEKLIYIVFSIVSNTLVYLGFRKKAIFFDLIIAVFFWLGFWLKFTVRVVFAEGRFYEAVGDFNYTGAAYDQALLVASVGMAGFLMASLVRGRYIFNYPCKYKEKIESQQGIITFYNNHRTFILVSFLFLILLISISNNYLGIYQRGAITKTVLPLGLNLIYKWLLLFGLSSFSAVIIKCELIEKRNLYWVLILSLFETFASNVSLLSRGMIINTSALAYGLYRYCKVHFIKIKPNFLAIYILLFMMLFLSSVYIVKYLRPLAAPVATESVSIKAFVADLKSTKMEGTTALFFDRWVGIEPVMAVTSSSIKGWGLFREALQEKFSENKMGFYDKKLITSPYIATDFNLYHHVSLPGIIAFFYYPDSVIFLFFSMFLASLLASLIEQLTYIFCGRNLILCSLMAEVVAFRFAHFGYAPGQTYLLFSAIIFNILLICSVNKMLIFWYKLKSNYLGC